MIRQLKVCIQNSQGLRNFVYTFLKWAGFLLGPYYQKQFQAYLASHEVRKLQIGCGSNLLPGWLNADLKIGKGVVFLDAGRPLPFDDGAFDFIFSEHLIEHLPYPAGKKLLKECFRVLKPGGKIRLATPDLQFLLDLGRPEKNELQKRYIEWASGRFKSTVPAPVDTFVINNFFRSWGHQFIYDFKILAAALEEAGFRDVTRCGVGESENSPLKKLESHGRHIGEEFNRLETMAAEASKPASIVL